MNGTATVQGFFRVVGWLVVFALVGLLLFLPSLQVTVARFPERTRERQLTQTVLLAVEAALLFWVPSLISGMVYVLSEWQRIPLLRRRRFVGVKGPRLFIVPPLLYSVASIMDIRITTHQVEATATLTEGSVYRPRSLQPSSSR